MLRGMTDSGDTTRLPLPSPQTSPPATSTGPDIPPSQPTNGSAPWLTDSAYAQPITHASGEFRRPERTSKRRWLRRGFFALILLVPIAILAVMVGVYWEARTASPVPSDAIVVLGAAQYNGNPTEVFTARLDEAYRLWSEGYAPLIVLTGGKMPGDAFTEAESGVQYLFDLGVPASAMVWENEGRDTWQSMQGVEEVLADRNVDSVIVVSDGFHLLRSELMARALGFETSGAASDASPIQPWSATEFGYIVRETGGIFVMLPEFLPFS